MGPNDMAEGGQWGWSAPGKEARDLEIDSSFSEKSKNNVYSLYRSA